MPLLDARYARPATDAAGTPAPPAPPVTPTQADPAVKAARDDARRRAAGLQGYRSTIATSPLGLQSLPATTSLKTLLGQ